MSASAAELSFARVLAHNEVRVRNRGVKKLKAWIKSKKQDYTRTEMLKLWKGLFYCMWMSDKMLVQQELATRIGELSLQFKSTSDTLLFLDCFCETMLREWQGLDRLRLDKFYMLISQCFEHVLVRLKRESWPKAAIEAYTKVISEGPLQASQKDLPCGIMFHLIDNYVGILSQVAVGIDSKVHLSLLMPIFELLWSSTSKIIHKRVVEGVIDRLIGESFPIIDEVEDDDQRLEGNYDQVVAWDAICELFFAKAADATTPDATRDRLYQCRRSILAARNKFNRALAARSKSTTDAAAVADSETTATRKRKADTDSDDTVATEVNGEAAGDELAALSPGARKRRRQRQRKEELAAQQQASGTTPSDATATQTSTGDLKKKKQLSDPATPDVSQKKKSKKSKKSKEAVDAPAASDEKHAKKSKKAAEPAQAEWMPATTAGLLDTPIKSALSPAGGGRQLQRRVSWGKNQVQRFKKQLPPSSLSAEKIKKQATPLRNKAKNAAE